MSSGEFLLVDADRAADIDRKQQFVGQLLAELKLDGLLLTRPSNFAWFTTGGDSTRGSWSDVNAALFLKMVRSSELSQDVLMKDLRTADEIGNNRQFNVRQKRRWSNLRAELARRISLLS